MKKSKTKIPKNTNVAVNVVTGERKRLLTYHNKCIKIHR